AAPFQKEASGKVTGAMTDLETYEIPEQHLQYFMSMADKSRHVDTTSEHVASMLEDPNVDVVVALWTDVSVAGGVATWVVKGLPILKAVVDNDQAAEIGVIAFWLRDRAHALAIKEALAAGGPGAKSEFVLLLEADGHRFEFEVVGTEEDPQAIYVLVDGR